MRRILMVCALVFAWASVASGWGTKGHGITGIIAEKYLSDAARAGVEDLIGRSRLVWISTWADVIRDEQPDTAPWHYVNIAPAPSVTTASATARTGVASSRRSRR